MQEGHSSDDVLHRELRADLETSSEDSDGFKEVNACILASG